MKNTLQKITEIITAQSAIEYAEQELYEIKLRYMYKSNYHEEYYQFMRDSFSGKNSPTISECEENAKRDFINQYAEMCQNYAGFLKHGKLFILNVSEKFVLFISKIESGYHTAITHFNPLNVDCFTSSMRTDVFMEYVQAGKYDISFDEMGLIEKCKGLINAK